MQLSGYFFLEFHFELTNSHLLCTTPRVGGINWWCTKLYWSSNAWSMDAGWNNSCHRVWILLCMYT